MIRMSMSTEFLHKQKIYIILLQEITHTDFDLIKGYNVYTNVD